MTFTHALSTNNYGPFKFVVATSAANGTHTTLASAVAAASSGDTIYLRDPVTENVTLRDGVNIACLPFKGGNGTAVAITGKLIDNGSAVNVVITGVTLTTNSDNCIALTGSGSSVTVERCSLNFSNATGINVDTNAGVTLKNCTGNLGTIGIAFWTGNGNITADFCVFTNSGASTTASNAVGGVNLRSVIMVSPLSTSSTGPLTLDRCTINTGAQNVTCLTTAGTNAPTLTASSFASGTAVAISIGSGTSVTCTLITVNSSNTNAIDGLGTIVNAGISFTGTSSKISTTTQTAKNFDVGGISFNGGTDILSSYISPTSWTPTLVGQSTAGTTTYSSQLGSYVRIGSLVWLWGNITITAATGTGNAVIGGLPITASGASNNYLGSCFLSGTGWAWPAGSTMLTPAIIPAAGTSMLIEGSGSSTANQPLQMTNAALNIWFTIVYRA